MLYTLAALAVLSASSPEAGPAAVLAPAPAPAPYSIPYQLRPAAAANVVRLDTSFATYTDAATGRGGSTVASFLLGTYQALPNFNPVVRLGVVGNTLSPTGQHGAVSFTNPLLGASYLVKLADFRVVPFLAVTLPIGTGGGNAPDLGAAAANRSGVLARAAMDNAMFAVNDFTIIAGVDAALVKGGFTVQLEATFLELLRVRGEAVQPDAAKTNFTSGLHLGYQVAPPLAVGVELRYQRWLVAPKAVAADATLKAWDNLSLALGLRTTLKLSDTVVARPAVVYWRGLDRPLSTGDWGVFQFDVPVSF
jgi:hypothetical protein